MTKTDKIVAEPVVEEQITIDQAIDSVIAEDKSEFAECIDLNDIVSQLDSEVKANDEVKISNEQIIQEDVAPVVEEQMEEILSTKSPVTYINNY